MKSISIILLHLGHGGIQKSAIKQANILIKYFHVEIAVVYKLKKEAMYHLDERVKVTYLTDKEPNRDKFISAVKKMKFFSAIKEGIQSIKILFDKKRSVIHYLKNNSPNIIISTRMIFNGSISKYASERSLLIAEEHQEHNFDKRYLRKVFRDTKDFDWLLPVSQSLVDYYDSLFCNERVNIKLLPNSFGEIDGKYSLLSNHKIVSVGRLAPEKGWMDLINVYENLVELGCDWTLDIIGDGSMYGPIKNKIDALNLNNRINLLGYKNENELFECLEESSIFVMCSYEESFGISLLEAFSKGVPAVVFSSANGFVEIIGDSKAGIIIDDRNILKMAETIFDLTQSHDKLNMMSNDAKNVAKKYTDDSIETLLLNFFRYDLCYDKYLGVKEE